MSVEKVKIAKLGRQIKLLQEEIWNERRLNGGRNAFTENQERIEKQVKILENRLDQALVQFNKTLEYDECRSSRQIINSDIHDAYLILISISLVSIVCLILRVDV